MQRGGEQEELAGSNGQGEDRTRFYAKFVEEASSSTNAVLCGALDELCGGRREAIWKVVAPRAAGLFEGTESEEARPNLARMSRAEQLVLDYERTGVSLSDHPMRLLRPRLPKKTLLP